MGSRLTRRALFALPVALPVAAVPAKAAPTPAYLDAGRIVVGVDGGWLSSSAVRRFENLNPLPFTIEELYEPGGKSPFRFVKTVSALAVWDSSEFTDAELAATLGIAPESGA